MKNGVAVIFSLIGLIGGILGVWEFSLTHPTEFHEFLTWGVGIGASLIGLFLLIVLIAAIGGRPGAAGLLLTVVVIGGSVVAAVYFATQYMPRAPREYLAVAFGVAAVVGVIVGVILLNGLARMMSND